MGYHRHTSRRQANSDLQRATTSKLTTRGSPTPRNKRVSLINPEVINPDFYLDHPNGLGSHPPQIKAQAGPHIPPAMLQAMIDGRRRNPIVPYYHIVFGNIVVDLGVMENGSNSTSQIPASGTSLAPTTSQPVKHSQIAVENLHGVPVDSTATAFTHSPSTPSTPTNQRAPSPTSVPSSRPLDLRPLSDVIRWSNGGDFGRRRSHSLAGSIGSTYALRHSRRMSDLMDFQHLGDAINNRDSVAMADWESWGPNRAQAEAVASAEAPTSTIDWPSLPHDKQASRFSAQRVPVYRVQEQGTPMPRNRFIVPLSKFGRSQLPGSESSSVFSSILGAMKKSVSKSTSMGAMNASLSPVKEQRRRSTISTGGADQLHSQKQKKENSCIYNRPIETETTGAHLPSCSGLPMGWTKEHDRFITYLATHAPLDHKGRPEKMLGEFHTCAQITAMLREKFPKFAKGPKITQWAIERRLDTLELLDNNYFAQEYGIYAFEKWGKGI